MIEAIFKTIIYAGLIIATVTALYGIIASRHALKRVIAFSMFSDLTCTLVIFLGYRMIKDLPNPPIMPLEGVSETVVSKATDPLPQCLVLTAIVIGLASLILISFMTAEIETEEGDASS